MEPQSSDKTQNPMLHYLAGQNSRKGDKAVTSGWAFLAHGTHSGSQSDRATLTGFEVGPSKKTVPNATVKLSDGDLASVKDGKTSCSKRDDGAFFGVKQPLKDATGKIMGISVMESPYAAAAGEEEAFKRANVIGKQVAQ